MRSIPKELLIHAVTLHIIRDKDRWGKAEIGTGTDVKEVRLESSSKVIRDKNNAEIQLTAMLFYDCRNSRPRGIVFVEDNVVGFNGQKFRIVSVEPLYDGRRLHHYEIGLVKYA